MAVEHKLMTGETFDHFLATHRDGLYELIHGEIVEKVPTEEHAKIAGVILGELYLYLKQHPEIKAHLGPEVRYRPEGDLYNDRLPDVSVQLSDQPPVTTTHRRSAMPRLTTTLALAAVPLLMLSSVPPSIADDLTSTVTAMARIGRASIWRSKSNLQTIRICLCATRPSIICSMAALWSG